MSALQIATAAFAFFILAARSIAQPPAADWHMLARNAAHTATSAPGPASIHSPLWSRSTNASGQAITFAGPSGVVTDGRRVYAQAQIAGQPRAIAFDAITGAPAWQSPMPARILDSWSTPAIDEANRTLLIASGAFLTAFRLSDGVVVWQTSIESGIVNASPIVTNDRGPRDRAFITNYGGFGDPTWLFCINVDPYLPGTNPYQSGELVWRTPLNAAVGATPAYASGFVYVATSGADFSHGEISAFNADASTAPDPWWTFAPPIFEGFYGGVSLARNSLGGLDLFAATYDFSGDRLSATLFKLDAATGQPLWSTPCNRSASIPIALGDGRIVLSGGVAGFGTVPTLQCFQDLGASATHLWDSAAQTWSDADLDGAMDLGEYLLLGGWSHHPALAMTPSGPSLFIGAIPTGPGLSAYATHHRIDLAQLPSQAGFVTGSFPGAGSTPALSGQMCYSFGPAGLHAFGPSADVTSDGLLDLDDLIAWHHTIGSLDVDRDSVTTGADRRALLVELRKGEHRDLTRGRP